MEFLIEFLFDLFVEVPMELTMESPRVKPWVKTALWFLLANLVTVLLVLIAVSMLGEEGRAGDGKVALVFAAVWFLGSLEVCRRYHKRGWQRERSCELKPATAPVRNVPNPDMVIRTATMADLDAIAAVEAECFPAAEAATRAEFQQRLTHYADHFWLMFDGNKLVSFVDGFVTNEPDLTDEMYANAALHDPAGQWQMIFGVNTIPAYRNHGYAAQLIEQAILDARSQGRKGLVLTCKPEKVPYYTKFGFSNEGITSNSTHGGVVWHQMRLTF